MYLAPQRIPDTEIREQGIEAIAKVNMKRGMILCSLHYHLPQQYSQKEEKNIVMAVVDVMVLKSASVLHFTKQSRKIVSKPLETQPSHVQTQTESPGIFLHDFHEW